MRLEKVWDGFEEIIQIGRRLAWLETHNKAVRAWDGSQEELRSLADDVQAGLLNPSQVHGRAMDAPPVRSPHAIDRGRSRDRDRYRIFYRHLKKYQVASENSIKAPIRLQNPRELS